MIRLTTVVLIATLMQVSAASLAQRVTINQKKTTLAKVFREIHRQTGYDFLYAKGLLDQKRLLDVKAENEPLEQVLEKALSGQSLSFTIEDKMIVIKEQSFIERVVAYFDKIDVSGKVVDERGQPIAGATIKVKGTDLFTSSGVDGTFLIKNVNENSFLVISYIGFQVREVKAAKELGNISLLVEVGELSEVIVNAGYYSVKDSERTGSISRITSKDIQNQPVGNVLSAAQGRMAGVSIVQTTGVPGGGYDIQIRGRNSLRNKNNSEIDGNTPLYVIDGIPFGSELSSQYSTVILPGRSINPLNSIHPNDIEKLEILKDADATAIYGSRGANGVVLVTTKKGKPGKMRLAFNSSLAMSSMVSALEMMDTQQYLAMRKAAFANNNITAYPATAYDINGKWDQGRFTDWREALLGNNAISSNNQLSVSGGSETTSFLISAGHQQQTTVFSKDFNYKTSNLSSQLSHRSVDGKFQLNTSNSFSIQGNNMLRSDYTKQAFNLSPNAPSLYKADGSLNWEENTFTNPVASFNATYSNEQKQFLNSLNMQYTLFKDFQVKLSGGLNYQRFEELSLQPNTMYNPAFVSGQSSANSRAFKNNQDRFSFILEPQLNWTYKSGDHQLDVLGGATFQREVSELSSVMGYGFESNLFLGNIAAAKTKVIDDQISSEYRYGAIFGRLNYQFNNRYIVNLTGRRDGSSRFGPNKKFANFAAIGAGWLFGKEDFLSGADWLSFGKLRGSFGTAGSDNIGDYQYLDTYTVSTSSVYNNINGIIPSRLYNPDYSWEKTTKLEFALEVGLFKNLIDFSLARYINGSTNQLIGYQLPSVAGFASVLSNLDAKVRNTGWEFELSARPLSGKFKWETGFNLTLPKNKLISFPALEGSSYANQFMVGYPTSIIKLYNLEGLNPATGAYVFTDYNGDGKISSPQDNRVVEDLTVKYFGGWNNSFSLGNLNLSFLFQFVSQRNRNYNNGLTVPGSMNNQPREVLNAWSAQNPSAAYMPYTTLSSPPHLLFQSSTAAVSDGSYIRLKNIQLAYKLPIKTAVFKHISLYMQGQNVLTFTNYFGVDPEFTVLGFLPPLKTYSFGLEFTL